MSDVQSRPSAPRGRGSYRGRGGYSSRGGRGGSRVQKSDDQENVPPSSLEDQGETGLLKKKYGAKVSSLKEIFPGWTDEDLVFALDETNGDIETAITGITDGFITQWGEVKKKHPDRSRSKVKETLSTSADGNNTSTRGGRGRGGFEGRGRGRGDRGDRGRGGRGGRAGAHTNGTRSADKPAKETTTSDGWDSGPAPTAEPGAWDNATSSKSTGGWDEPTNGEAAPAGDWASIEPKEPVKEAPKDLPKSSVIPEGSKKGWASLFAKPPPAPAPVPKKAPALAVEEKPIEATEEESEPVEASMPLEEAAIPQDAVTALPEAPASDPPLTLTPSKDELTESNVERLPDVSISHTTDTAASTVASTHDPSVLTSAPPANRPGISGYAASAFKATSGSGRSASFQRRVMEQQEAVVMPGNHAVDRAAVQFGSMGLNGSAEDLDVDEEREEAETRAQPPTDSPIAPRASLPPPTQQPQAASEPVPAARPAPGLPPAPQQPQSSSPPQTSAYNSFGRYGEAPQKPFDPFGQQQSQAQPQAHEQYPSSMPAQSQPATSTAGNDYSPFYSSNQQRDYQNYYANYAQGQEAGAGQQRAGSGFGTSAPDVASQYATSHPQARYGQPESQGSGHNTPNPTLPGQQQAQPAQQMPQGQGAYGGYPYGYPNANYQYHPQYNYMNHMTQAQQSHQYGRNRPMFDDARRYDDGHPSHGNQYSNYGSHYGAPYGKGNVYNQPQHPYSYEHSASPANVGGFNQPSLGGRETAYGRTGSTQPSESQQSAGGNAFGGMPDVFGRSQSGFGQAQGMTQQHSGQQAGVEDPAKTSYEAPKVSGPSPSLQANRPGSAANNMGGQQPGGQSGFPPASQHSGQQGFGGYGQYGGLGGLGGQQQGAGQNHHQGSQYGGGYAGFGNYGYGQQTSGRGGWSGNYGH